VIKENDVKKIHILKKRVENLEHEQEEQDKALVYLRDLESLSGIHIDEFHGESKENDEESITLEITIEDIEEELGLSTPKKPEHGYVISLIFDPNNPAEWSEEAGGGWRDRGMGTRYEAATDVKSRLKSLKKQWPTYPLRITKV